MPKHRTPAQQTRDNPVTHVDIMPVSEVFASKSKCKLQKVELTKLVHGNHGWVDVPGEDERRYMLFSKPQGIFLSPSRFEQLRVMRARENRARRPWLLVRREMDDRYSPRPA